MSSGTTGTGDGGSGTGPPKVLRRLREAIVLAWWNARRHRRHR